MPDVDERVCAKLGPPPHPVALGFRCTLPEGHAGAHEVWIDGHRIDMWPDCFSAAEQRFLIIAGNAREAEQFRLEHGLTRQQTFYVSRPGSLRGKTLDSGWTIVRVGSWGTRRDLLKIEDELGPALHGATTPPRRITYPTANRARSLERDA